jgi:hypothetical protein
MTSSQSILAGGGTAGSGGNGLVGVGVDGGSGGSGGLGGFIDIDVLGFFTQAAGATSFYAVNGGAGAQGGDGVLADGNGGDGGIGAAAGTIAIYSCSTTIEGTLVGEGGGGGTGGNGALTNSDGGSGESAGDGGTITVESGGDLTLAGTALLNVNGGQVGLGGSGVGAGSPGSPGFQGGNGGEISRNFCALNIFTDNGATYTLLGGNGAAINPGTNGTLNPESPTALCCAGIPTMNEWGMMIFIVLAGLSSFYFLRRKRVKTLFH